MASKVRWTNEQLFNNLRRMSERGHRYMTRITNEQAIRSETYAKSNARWHDRTTNARNGLTAVPDIDAAGKVYRVIVFHKVPYGIWLETKYSGRYAIIAETVKVGTREFISAANKVLTAIASGGAG